MRSEFKYGVAGAMLALRLCVAGEEPQGGPPSADYELLFKDEFDAPALNESVWDYRVGRRGGGANFTGIDGMNLKEAVTQSDGRVRIKVYQQEMNGRRENVGGGITTKQRFGYGYYECLYRPFMLGKGGVHSAFWQRGVSEKKGSEPQPVQNTIFEIDSSEVDNPHWVGTNNLYVVTAPKGVNDGVPWPARFHIPITPLKDGWFLDAYEYRPDGITFYDNGKIVASIAYDTVRGQQEVWLTALNGFGKVDGSVQPGESDFEYFRYYAKDWPGANLIANDGFEYNLDSIDPQHPIAWWETGDVAASRVETGEAFRDKAKLRHASADGKAYSVTTGQSLQHIKNGTYVASAMVRSSGGQKTAEFRVSGTGGPDKMVAVPAGSTWTRVSIPDIEVKNNSATLSFRSEAAGEQWLEVDSVEFMKPADPAHPPKPPKPFAVIGDPIWRILDGQMMNFADGRQILFGREVGLGAQFTVRATVKPDKTADQMILERMPPKGTAGWSIRMSPAGDLVFRIGSVESHEDVVAPKALSAGKTSSIACVFNGGSAMIYVDGKQVASGKIESHQTTDVTAAGAVSMARNPNTPHFAGEIGDIRIHNRELDAAEISK